MTKLISRLELQNMMYDTKLVLIEALPEHYFRSGHLPNALHLPHDKVDQLAAILLPDSAAPIVVYCANIHCQNSHKAARRLEQLGYVNVAVYAGGKQDWHEAGLALHKLELDSTTV